MKKLLMVVCVMACCVAPVAQAAKKGDFIIKGGVATVQPQGDGALDGALDVDGNTQVGLTATYMASNNLGIQLLASTPFKHDITLSGDVVGDTKHLPPTLTLQYHFSPDADFNPYVGAGINYTVFFDESSSLGDLDLDASLGYALEAGFNYKIDNNWGAGTSVWYAAIETDAKLDGADLATVEINPIVVMAFLYYRF